MKEKVEKLFQRVCAELALEGLSICWCGDPWYQEGLKKVHMKTFGSYDGTAQCLLHELTHAIHGGGHGRKFWQTLECLVKRYLNTTLNEHQSTMKRDYLGTALVEEPVMSVFEKIHAAVHKLVVDHKRCDRGGR